MVAHTTDKRERLVDAAKKLIHHQGYNQTSLADIADESGVPLGNVYYYFKTKEEIAKAVIEDRTEEFRQLILKLEKNPDPRKRLLAFVDYMKTMSESVVNHGCPIATLTAELNKDRSDISRKVGSIVRLQLDWFTKQFQLMQQAEAKELGIQFITSVYGIASILGALGKSKLMDKELQRLKGWLRNL